MNGAESSVYMTEEGYAQIPEEAQPPFGAEIGGNIGGNFAIDGTPMRLVTIIIAAVLLVVLYHYADFRWHVTI